MGDHPGECSRGCQYCYNYKGKCSECEAQWKDSPYQLDWMDKDSFFSTYERKQCKHCDLFEGDSAAQVFSRASRTYQDRCLSPKARPSRRSRKLGRHKWVGQDVRPKETIKQNARCWNEGT